MTQDPIPILKRAVAAQIKLELARHYASGAAMLMQTDLPRVSDLKRGKLSRFSLETLIRHAARLGLAVDVQVRRRSLITEAKGEFGAGPGA